MARFYERQGMNYLICDEEGQIMRKVGRREEAKQIVQLRQGWTFTRIHRPKLDLSQFEDALI